MNHDDDKNKQDSRRNTIFRMCFHSNWVRKITWNPFKFKAHLAQVCIAHFLYGAFVSWFGTIKGILHLQRFFVSLRAFRLLEKNVFFLLWLFQSLFCYIFHHNCYYCCDTSLLRWYGFKKSCKSTSVTERKRTRGKSAVHFLTYWFGSVGSRATTWIPHGKKNVD